MFNGVFSIRILNREAIDRPLGLQQGRNQTKCFPSAVPEIASADQEKLFNGRLNLDNLYVVCESL
jgi:hypothetical protein